MPRDPLRRRARARRQPQGLQGMLQGLLRQQARARRLLPGLQELLPDPQRRPVRAPEQLPGALRTRKPGRLENGAGRTSGAMIRPITTTANTGPGRPPAVLRLRRDPQGMPRDPLRRRARARQPRRGAPLQLRGARRQPGRAPRRRRDPPRRRLPARRRQHPRRPWRRTFTERAARRPEPSRRS